jgi:hypothetical protein
MNARVDGEFFINNEFKHDKIMNIKHDSLRGHHILYADD